MIEDAGIADEDVERAWRLTRAAYDDPEHEGLEIDDTRAIIDISGRHVHVAFRGTATPLNAAHDVAFLLLPLSDFPALRVGDDEWAARVHGGFAKMASNVADRLAERLEKWPRRTVVLSGHSLGGALAILVGGAERTGPFRQLCTSARRRLATQYARLLDVPCCASRTGATRARCWAADHGGLGGRRLPMVRGIRPRAHACRIGPWSAGGATPSGRRGAAGAAPARRRRRRRTEPRPAAETSTAQAPVVRDPSRTPRAP